jgi:integrase
VVKSNRKSRKNKSDKPAKPYPDFPLFAHATKRWAKKIKGRMCYFGPWDDPDGALKKYLDQKDDLHAGRMPRNKDEGLSVADLVNIFLTDKKHRLETGELTPQSYGENYAACQRIIEGFGRTRLVSDLRPADFKRLEYRFAKEWGPHKRAKTVQLIRSAFNFAWNQNEIDKPVKFGDFKKPKQKVFRLHRAKSKNQNGKRMFSADQLRLLLAEVGQPLRAMILLGANCGLGNNDVSMLPFSALDLEQGWLDYPRPKNGIARRCPLWPETVEAIKEAIASRPAPKNPEHAGRVFLTARGNPWVKVELVEEEIGSKKKVSIVNDDAIAKEMAKVLKKLNLKRPGLNFYALRHGLQTVAEERAADPAGIRLIMGHADESNDMSSRYREDVSDERLRKIVDAVREWLFPREPHDDGATVLPMSRAKA